MTMRNKMKLQQSFKQDRSLIMEPEPEIRIKTRDLVQKIQKDPQVQTNTHGSEFLLQSQRYFGYDSGHSVYREEPQFIKRRCCVFRLDSRFRICWDLSVIVLSLWNVFFIPLNIAFKPKMGENSNVIALNIFIDFVFLIDIVLNVRTSYINHEGEEIMDPRLITSNYIRNGRFFLDFLAIIPLDAIPGLNFFEFLGILKLTRILRVPTLVKKVNLTETTKNIIKVLEVIVLLIILYHITACVWYLGVASTNEWIPPVNWIAVNRYGRSFYEDISLVEAYLVSLYYGVMSINSGQIGPRTTLSLGLAILLMFSGMFINALLFGTMAELTLQLKRKERAQQENLDTANTIMLNMKIPVEQRRQVVKYLMEVRNTKARQQELMWLEETISPYLREQVRQTIFEKMIAQNKIFKAIIENQSNPKDLINREILAYLQIKHFEPENLILECQSQASEIYFVAKGKVVVYQKNGVLRRYSKLTMLVQGEHFGEIGVLFNSPRTMRVASHKYCILARMSRKNLLKMARWYPDILLQFKKHIQTYQDKLKRTLSKILPRLSLFKPLEKHELLQVIYSFQMLSLYPGQFLFERGQPTKGMYVIIKGIGTLSLDLKGLHFPVKILKKGSIYGYDSIMMPNTNLLSMNCYNCKYRRVTNSRSKNRNSLEEDSSPIRVNESVDFFINQNNSEEGRRGTSFMQINSMRGSSISFSQKMSLLSSNMSIRPDLIFQARGDEHANRFSLQSKSEKRKSQFSERANQQSFENSSKSPKNAKKLVGIKRELAHSAIAFLSNEKFESLLQEIPNLKKAATQELDRIEFQELRPYLMDYYIPFKTPENLDLVKLIEFTTKKQGGRDSKFKFKNAVLYTIMNNSSFTRSLTLSDKILNYLNKTEGSLRNIEYSPSMKRARSKTTSSHIRTMILGAQENYISDIKSTQVQLTAQVSVLQSKVVRHNTQIVRMRNSLIQAQDEVEELVTRLRQAEGRQYELEEESEGSRSTDRREEEEEEMLLDKFTS